MLNKRTDLRNLGLWLLYLKMTELQTTSYFCDFIFIASIVQTKGLSLCLGFLPQCKTYMFSSIGDLKCLSVCLSDLSRVYSLPIPIGWK